MKKLKWTSSSHDGLGRMLGLGHLSSFTSTTETVFGESDFLNPEDMFLQHQFLKIPIASASESSMPQPAFSGTSEQASSNLWTFREIYNIYRSPFRTPRNTMELSLTI